MPTPKVLILTGDAAESLEVMYPYQRLREEGYEVHIAAPSKKMTHYWLQAYRSTIWLTCVAPQPACSREVSFNCPAAKMTCIVPDSGVQAAA